MKNNNFTPAIAGRDLKVIANPKGNYYNEGAINSINYILEYEMFKDISIEVLLTTEDTNNYPKNEGFALAGFQSKEQIDYFMDEAKNAGVKTEMVLAHSKDGWASWNTTLDDSDPIDLMIEREKDIDAGWQFCIIDTSISFARDNVVEALKNESISNDDHIKMLAYLDTILDTFDDTSQFFLLDTYGIGIEERYGYSEHDSDNNIYKKAVAISVFQLQS